jgi:hypothetical protein
MTLKLVEWKWDNNKEIVLLDTIETEAEWNAMSADERSQLDLLLADADRTIGYLIGRDVEDENLITIFGEHDIVEMVAV